MARLLEVKRVLELGSGMYSTLAFLDRSAFPDLTNLDSFEDDPAWADKIFEMTKADPRCSLTLVDRPIGSVIADTEMADYDLIFVDYSQVMSVRSRTIRDVASHAAASNVIVMHDYETPEYRAAACPLPNRFRFTAFNPNTGVGWILAALQRKRLKKLNRLIKRYAKTTDPTNLNEWVRIIDRGKWNA
jgi:hypothetical protein